MSRHLADAWGGTEFKTTNRLGFGGDVEPLTSADAVGRSRQALKEYQADILAEYKPYTPLTAQNLKKLADLKFRTLAIMHGSSFTEADVWGRVRRTVESYRAQAQASAADLATVNLSMHANLAVDYFAARSLDAEEKLLQDTVVQYQNALD